MLEADAVEDLFRFTLLLTGNRENSCTVVAAGLSRAVSHAAELRAPNARWIWVARWIWESSKKRETGSLSYGRDLSQELEQFFEPIGPEQRAALALRSLGHLEVEEMAQILRVRPNDLRKQFAVLHEARHAAGLDEVVLRDGVAALRATAEEHAAFVAAWHRLGTSPTAGARAVAGEEGDGGGDFREKGARMERAIGLAAVIFGVVFMAVFLLWERSKSGGSGQTREQVERLLEFNEASNRAEFEPVDGGKEQLRDWLYLRGLEAVGIPAPLDRLKLVAGRVTQWRGSDVAQLVSDNPKAVLLIVNKSNLLEPGVEVIPGQVSKGGWSARWMVEGRYLVLVAVPGEMAALETILSRLK